MGSAESAVLVYHAPGVDRFEKGGAVERQFSRLSDELSDELSDGRSHSSSPCSVAAVR